MKALVTWAKASRSLKTKWRYTSQYIM